MIYARFNSTNYKIANRPSLAFSARETTFTSIQIDFTGKTASDLPIKYQQIQVVDGSDVLYYGYCSQPTLPVFDGKEERVLLNIELLSPQTYLTKRTTDVSISNINIHDAVATILSVVTGSDGFTVEENNLPTTEYLSDVFLHTSIEKILSNLAGRFNFIWYVDELKKIYLRHLPSIEAEATALDITSINTKYLKSVQPSFEVSDYANMLNFTNVNLISGQALIPNSTVLVNGETYTFAYPFSISDYVVYRMSALNELIPNLAYAFYLSTTATNAYKIEVDILAKTTTYDSTIGFLGEDDNSGTKVLLLTRDAQNSNLITGFKWVSATQTIDSGIGCASYSTLKPITLVYLDPFEIDKNATKTNTSGIIEREVNVNGKYFTYNELTAYAKNFLKQNNKQADTVNLIFEGSDAGFTTLKNKLALTKKVSVNLPSQFIDDTEFVITDIDYSINMDIETLKIIAKSSSLAENYIDIFRKSTGQDEDIQNKAIVFYNQDEKIIISREIIVNGEVVNV